MTDVNRAIDRYVSLWNESDPERRRELIVQTFTEDASYLGPSLGGDGHAGLAVLADSIEEHLGGYRFVLTGGIDAHHDRVRYTWEILPLDGAPRFAAGTDFAVITADGRLQSVTAFLDQTPAETPPH